MAERTQKLMIPMLKPVALPRTPWERIAMDIKGPLKEGPFKYLLVVVDSYSKWPEVTGLTSITSRNIIMALRWMFGRFGYPKKIVTDKDPNYAPRR